VICTIVLHTHVEFCLRLADMVVPQSYTYQRTCTNVPTYQPYSWNKVDMYRRKKILTLYRTTVVYVPTYHPYQRTCTHSIVCGPYHRTTVVYVPTYHPYQRTTRTTYHPYKYHLQLEKSRYVLLYTGKKD